MKIQICNGKMCKSRFSEYIKKRIENDIEKFDLKNIILENCSCIWQCEKWPNVIFDWHIENQVNPTKASKIIQDKIKWRI